MDRYDVILYKRAYRDLEDIYSYIANEKFSPENAKAQAGRIKTAILKLEQLPQSYQERQEGRYAKKGYRQLLRNIVSIMEY